MPSSFASLKWFNQTNVEATRETIIICRNGEPVADRIPHKRTKSNPTRSWA